MCRIFDRMKQVYACTVVKMTDIQCANWRAMILFTLFDQVGSDYFIFFFTNFNISSVFGIQDTLLLYNPSGLHSQTPRRGALEGLGFIKPAAVVPVEKWTICNSLRNIYACHHTWYFCRVTWAMMHHIYVWYPWYTIFMTGSRLRFYVL